MSRDDDPRRPDDGRPDDGLRDGDVDAYLWDGGGPPDDEVAALERELRRHRWRGGLDDATAGTADDGLPPILRLRDRGPARVAAGIAAAILLLFIGREILRPAEKPVLHVDLDGVPGTYRVEVLAGSPTITGADEDAVLGHGGAVVCDEGDRARIRVGDIGEIVVHADTRLRVEAPGARAPDADYLLYLERGSVLADILAAPRLFQVGTPAGIAVDLGCRYTATVDEQGRTHLDVLLGKVAFETAGRAVTVPSGASVVAWPGLGPGTPAWNRSDDALHEAVEVLDRARSGPLGPDPARAEAERDQALKRLVGAAVRRDALTFFHLLDHPDPAVVDTALDALLDAYDLPSDVTRVALRTDQGDARHRYWESLPWN